MPQISPESMIHAATYGRSPVRGAGGVAPWVAYYAQPQSQLPQPGFHSGVTHEADVVALAASVGGQMAATNTMVLACSSLQPADVQAWSGIYQAWQALLADWSTWKTQQDEIPSIDLIDQAAALAVNAQYAAKINAGTLGQPYAQWAAVYQTKAAAACPGIQPPVQPIGPPSPNPNNPPDSPSGPSFTTVVLVVVAAGAVAVGVAWLAPILLASLAARTATRALEG